jgi:hypothetical protein
LVEATNVLAVAARKTKDGCPAVRGVAYGLACRRWWDEERPEDQAKLAELAGWVRESVRDDDLAMKRGWLAVDRACLVLAPLVLKHVAGAMKQSHYEGLCKTLRQEAAVLEALFGTGDRPKDDQARKAIINIAARIEALGGPEDSCTGRAMRDARAAVWATAAAVDAITAIDGGPDGRSMAAGFDTGEAAAAARRGICSAGICMIRITSPYDVTIRHEIKRAAVIGQTTVRQELIDLMGAMRELGQSPCACQPERNGKVT